jgi:hypothetical protein
VVRKANALRSPGEFKGRSTTAFIEGSFRNRLGSVRTKQVLVLVCNCVNVFGGVAVLRSSGSMASRANRTLQRTPFPAHVKMQGGSECREMDRTVAVITPRPDRIDAIASCDKGKHTAWHRLPTRMGLGVTGEILDQGCQPAQKPLDGIREDETVAWLASPVSPPPPPAWPPPAGAGRMTRRMELVPAAGSGGEPGLCNESTTGVTIWVRKISSMSVPVPLALAPSREGADSGWGTPAIRVAHCAPPGRPAARRGA